MRIGLIGYGNMGSSFLKGIAKTGKVSTDEVMVYDIDAQKLEEAEEIGVEITESLQDLDNCDYLFIAVKPDKVGKVIEDLEPSSDQVLISFAAGLPIKKIKNFTDTPVIRVMPNLAVEVGEMASAYSIGSEVNKRDEDFVKELLEEVGSSVKVSEELLNAVTALSGSGPAFVFLIIKALRDGGKELGLNENDSTTLATQTVKGAAEVVESSDLSIEELIEMVCSPKGTTIEGMKILEDEGVQDSVKNALRAAFERAEELSRE